MAFDQGFAPGWRCCSCCGADLLETGGARFVVEEGRVLCPGCRYEGRGTAVSLGQEALALLSLVECSPPGEWSRQTPGPQARMECGRALDMLVRYHLGLTWEHGSFTRI